MVHRSMARKNEKAIDGAAQMYSAFLSSVLHLHPGKHNVMLHPIFVSRTGAPSSCRIAFGRIDMDHPAEHLWGKSSACRMTSVLRDDGTVKAELGVRRQEINL